MAVGTILDQLVCPDEIANHIATALQQNAANARPRLAADLPRDGCRVESARPRHVALVANLPRDG